MERKKLLNPNDHQVIGRKIYINVPTVNRILFRNIIFFIIIFPRNTNL